MLPKSSRARTKAELLTAGTVRFLFYFAMARSKIAPSLRKEMWCLPLKSALLFCHYPEQQMLIVFVLSVIEREESSQWMLFASVQFRLVISKGPYW